MSKNKEIRYVGQPIFKQIIDLVEKVNISSIIKVHESDRYYKAFKSKTHLITMLAFIKKNKINVSLKKFIKMKSKRKNIESNFILVLVSLIMLSITMCMSPSNQNKKGANPEIEAKKETVEEHSFKGNFDWEAYMVIADRKRDETGLLLPLQSYEETIARGVSFLLDDHLSWFKGDKSILVDENGETQMPWLYYSNVQHNGEPFPKSIDRFTSYPAFHHSLFIKTFVKLFNSSGDEQVLNEAIKLAKWNIAHSTPSDWAYAGIPYSTLEEKKPGGFRDGSGIMPDKASIMALSYLDLYEASGDDTFLKGAETIAQSLTRNQRDNGTWPFRIDPKTKEVIEEYTSSVIYAIMLFERLDGIHGTNNYKPYRDKTWNWLWNGPIKTKEFRGFYEDIEESKDGRTNYDCLDVIRYLLANRTEENNYLETALELNAWIEELFLVKIEGFEPAEGINEQLQCFHVMGIHSLNWASMLTDLADASGDEMMKERAIQTANYITYYVQPDDRIVVGFEYHQWWYSCHIGVILYLLDFLKEV